MKYFFLFLFLLIQVVAADMPDSTSNDDFRFAEWLYETGDYYRAVTYYKRHIFLNPAADNLNEARLKTGLSYLAGRKYPEALSEFSAVSDSAAKQEIREKAAFLFGLAYYESGDLDNAKSAFDRLKKNYPGTKYIDQGLFLSGVGYFRKWEWQKANSSFEEITAGYPESPLLAPAGRLKELSLNPETKMPKKYPALAGVLSALLPGAGQFYSERPTDAMSSFLWNLGLGYLAYSSYDSEMKRTSNASDRNFTTAYTVGGLFSLFYLSNIYGAINTARNANFLIKVNYSYSAIDRENDYLKLILEQKF